MSNKTFRQHLNFRLSKETANERWHTESWKETDFGETYEASCANKKQLKSMQNTINEATNTALRVIGQPIRHWGVGNKGKKLPKKKKKKKKKRKETK